MPNGSAAAQAINRDRVVAGYAGGPGVSLAATVWSNLVPPRLTPPDTPHNWAWDTNDAGDIAGVLFGDGTAGNPNRVARLSPPYETSVADLGRPAAQPNVEQVRINNRGDAVGVLLNWPGNLRFSFRYNSSGVWGAALAARGCQRATRHL
jgi:hypothetical protein